MKKEKKPSNMPNAAFVLAQTNHRGQCMGMSLLISTGCYCCCVKLLASCCFRLFIRRCSKNSSSRLKLIVTVGLWPLSRSLSTSLYTDLYYSAALTSSNNQDWQLYFFFVVLSSSSFVDSTNC